MDVKQELHSLVDQLHDEQAGDAVAYLRGLVREDRPQQSESVGDPVPPVRPLMISGRDFFAARRSELAALAAKQGTQPVAHFEELLGDFWPEDETAEEFIAAVHGWRREGGCG